MKASDRQISLATRSTNALPNENVQYTERCFNRVKPNMFNRMTPNCLLRLFFTITKQWGTLKIGTKPYAGGGSFLDGWFVCQFYLEHYSD